MIEKVYISEDRLKLPEIKGYVQIIYEHNWQLAYVLAKNENDKVKMSFFHPAGPSFSFSYPNRPDILWVSVIQILSLVNPITPTGSVYRLPKNEALKINEMYKNFK